MQEKIFNEKITLSKFLIQSFATVFTSISILFFAPNYFLVFVVVLVPFLFIYILNKPFLLLQILIMTMPFTIMPFLDVQIMGIPGLKVINIIFVVTFLSFVLSKIATNIHFHEKLFIVGVIFLLLISVIRSVPHLQMINLDMNHNHGVFGYFQSYFLKPIIYFSPFIFISLYVSDFKKVELVLKALMRSIFIFSVILLAIYVFLTPDKTDFQNVKASFTSILHLHGNNMATIYLLAFPLMVSYFYMKKNLFSILNIILCIISIGLLYARTAYVLVVVSIFMYLFFSKKLSWTPIVCCLLFFSISFLPSSITKRAISGIEVGDVRQISSGRVHSIWAPLVDEISHSQKKLIVGSGRHATIFSDSYRDGKMARVGHAHNLYLNTIVEVGLLGLTFFALFYIRFLKNFIKAINKKLNGGNEIQILIGVVVSIFSYFIAGITGRQIFPTINNYLFWLILGIGSAILKIQAKKETF